LVEFGSFIVQNHQVRDVVVNGLILVADYALQIDIVEVDQLELFLQDEHTDMVDLVAVKSKQHAVEELHDMAG